MRVYKLTDAEGRTRDGIQWGEGITHTASGHGELYGGTGWIHAYTHPLLAVLLDTLFANYLSKENAILWEADADGQVRTDHGLNLGVTSLTTRRRIPVPPVTMEQRVRFSVLCALEVYREPKWVAWARAWLDGTDRNADKAICAAAEAAATAHFAGRLGDTTVYTAGNAANLAAHAAADAPTYGARSTAHSAAHAASLAAEAEAVSGELDLIALAEEAVGVPKDGS